MLQGRRGSGVIFLQYICHDKRNWLPRVVSGSERMPVGAISIARRPLPFAGGGARTDQRVLLPGVRLIDEAIGVSLGKIDLCLGDFWNRLAEDREHGFRALRVH